MTIKRILVSQPKPENGKSPFNSLAKKNGLEIDFRPFIHVEDISAKDFRKTRINISNFSAVIFTSRTAVDHFFRICKEMRIPIKNSTKYFCISESTAHYLQKYILYRKRKIFFGERSIENLLPMLKKHAGEKYFLPVSAIHKLTISKFLKKNKINFQKAALYRTVRSDLSDLKDVNYDILVFYSPSGIESLLKNFPDFQQKNTKIASFGPSTAKAVADAGLQLNIKAPMPDAPSMTMALEKFINKFNKKEQNQE